MALSVARRKRSCLPEDVERVGRRQDSSKGQPAEINREEGSEGVDCQPASSGSKQTATIAACLINSLKLYHSRCLHYFVLDYYSAAVDESICRVDCVAVPSTW